MNLTRRFYSICILLMLSGTLRAGENVVWQIGKCDGNYAELAIARRGVEAYTGSFPSDVTFLVGKDDAAKAWPYIQPGPADGWAGSKTHPFTIIFNIPDKPKGSYRLSISLVNTHSVIPPTYEISVNGNTDRVDLPPGAGDEAMANASKGKPHTLDVAIPASYFRSGENRIVLQSVKGSWLLYDAVRLLNDPNSTVEPTIKSITLTPAPRFVRRGSQLKQIVVLNAQFSSAGDERTARVNFGGKTSVLQLRPGVLSGTTTADIEVDEVAKPVPMEAVVQSGGQTKTRG